MVVVDGAIVIWVEGGALVSGNEQVSLKSTARFSLAAHLRRV